MRHLYAHQPSQSLMQESPLQTLQNQALLTAHKLSCERSGVLLFEDFDLSVSAGELLQIVGPNGSGKSSLLRILAGLSSYYEGRVTTVSPFLYQGHKLGLKAMLSPLENLRWYISSQAHTHKTDEDILAALERWQLRGYEHQACYQLSAGQQQRVILARLLLSDAKLWLLDEPFTAIDQAGIAQLELLLLAHVEKGGAAVLTTHHLFRQNDRMRYISLQPVLA